VSWTVLWYHLVMLEVLRDVLVQRGGPPERVAAALRQTVGAVWASQVGLIAVVGIAVVAFTKPAGADDSWAWVFLAVSAVAYALVAAITSNDVANSPKLVTGLKAAILLGAISALPVVLSVLLLALDGLSAGLILLLLTAFAVLFLAFGQVTQYGYVIAAQKPDDTAQDEPFQGWATDDPGPDAFFGRHIKD
jgi:hypothetical protein